MDDSPSYKSLVVVVAKIAHDPPLPGNRKAICRCMDRLDDFLNQSRITTEEWETLKLILIDACP
jgi:hypothetical protein